MGLDRVAKAGSKHLQITPQGTDAADNPAQPQQIKMCDEGWGEEKKCLFLSSLFLSLLLLHSSPRLRDLVPWVELELPPLYLSLLTKSSRHPVTPCPKSCEIVGWRQAGTSKKKTPEEIWEAGTHLQQEGGKPADGNPLQTSAREMITGSGARSQIFISLSLLGVLLLV